MNLKYQVRFCFALALFKLTTSEIVQIEDGRLEGTLMETRRGEQFHAFKKIPFAEPPLGKLRFLPPQAKQPWSGILDCTKYGPMCAQPKPSYEISEDCLHLNVYTKNLPSAENTELKPVIAFIPGGGFRTGGAIDYGPEYLMERDFVLVTIAYRIGAFGFLALETLEASGNQGLKDQVLGLKWIQKNIRQFGGDPTKVTIAGQSAGAWSTTGHLISPMSQGLFRSAIAMSGSISWPMKFKQNNINVTKLLAERISCPLENIGDMFECLKYKPAEEIAENEVSKNIYCDTYEWLPVVEPELGQERFLPEDPTTLLRNGSFAKVPVIIGVTENEFGKRAAQILDSPNLTAAFNERFAEIISSCLFYDDTNGVEAIGKGLREIYLPYEIIDRRSFNDLSNLFVDGLFGHATHRFVHFITNFTDVYYYKFSYVGSASTFYYPHDKPYSVNHADDLRYIFNRPVATFIELTDPENIFVERLTRIWDQFARNGNPNNANDEFLSELNWPKHTTADEYFLDIGKHFVEKNGMFLKRYVALDALEVNSCFALKASLLVVFLPFMKLFL